MLLNANKNWDAHVVPAEDVARSQGFQALRDRIVELASPRADDTVVDIGAGTGLLTLPLAGRCKHVYAIDISPLMGEYLSTKASSAELANVEFATAPAISLPIVDESVDLVVSNYCFHHLRAADKERAVAEVFRVLRPGGRFVFGDMMFRLSVANGRDRRLIADKVSKLASRGPSGILRLLKNSMRVASGNWEYPARADWWDGALRRAGFVDVEVQQLEHEGGIAVGYRPDGDAGANGTGPR